VALAAAAATQTRLVVRELAIKETLAETAQPSPQRTAAVAAVVLVVLVATVAAQQVVLVVRRRLLLFQAHHKVMAAVVVAAQHLRVLAQVARTQATVETSTLMQRLVLRTSVVVVVAVVAELVLVVTVAKA